MDSGNSGSMQSSGSNEEYNSRSESATLPIFLNPSSNNDFGNYQNQQPPPTFFDIPSSNNHLHALSQSQHSSNPSFFLNLDLVGSRTNENPSTVNLHASSSSLAAAHHQGLINHGSFSSSSSSSMQQHQSQFLNDQTNVVAKNPKKRTRTSRRAPTTVLTTDTSNFRAMVQELTGIPAQPFSAGLSYPRRLDLFKSGNNLEPMGPLNYPLRPATQKFEPISFVSDAIAAAATSDNYQLPSDLRLNNKEPQNTLNNFMQQNLNHPVVSFQSVLQHSTLNPGTFSANKSQASNLGVRSFEDHQQHLAMSHAHVGLPNQQDHLRSFEGNFGNSSQRVTSCKLNYSASSSDFHHDKNLENVSTRGEGTVDSWIYPSD